MAELPRTDNRAYDLRQRLNRAIRWLREAEDIARIEMPAWPTADRIRDIYEQVGEDVLNGRTTVPPLLQRLRESEARVEALEAQRDEALKLLAGALKGHGPAPCTFSRGEMADLEMALHALQHGAQGGV
jgi:hypothetical protein